MSLKFTRTSLLLILLLFNLHLFAQQRTVTGVVTGQDTNESLARVAIGTKGADRSTTINEKGELSIVVPSNETVFKFTSVGFGYQEVTVGARNTLSVSLGRDNRALDDVVEVGYGAQKE